MTTLEKLLKLRREREALDAEIEALEDAIKARMGDDEELRQGKLVVRWAWITSRRIDTAAIKAEAPEIAERFTKETRVRRFTLTA